MPDKAMSGGCGAGCSNVNPTVSTGKKDFENNPQVFYYSILLFL
jgi:hypothetical protein